MNIFSLIVVLSYEIYTIDTYVRDRGISPFAVCVQRDYVHICGGAIIGPIWVLTNYECIYTKRRDTIETVRYGVSDCFDRASPQATTRFVIDTKYGKYGCSILQVDIPFVYSHSTYSATFPIINSMLPEDGTIGKVAEWVKIYNDYPLLITQLPFEDCKTLLKKRQYEFCAGLNGEIDGLVDYGAPFTINNTLYGLVSSKTYKKVEGYVLTRASYCRALIFRVTGMDI